MIVAVVILLVAACARRGKVTADADTNAAFQNRAWVVTKAWRAALEGPAGRAWQTSFVPLQDLTVPPAQGFTADTRFAFESGWYRTRVALPEGTPSAGAIRFPDGTTLRVPLVSARVAYAAMHRGDAPCRRHPGQVPTPPPGGSGPGGSVGAPAEYTCATLTITGASLGTTTLRTSRGLAIVPAWLFTVAELPAPVARVAVTPAAVSPLPRPSVPSMDAGRVRLAPALKLTRADDGRLSYTVGIGSYDHNPAGLAYETADAVVIGGTYDAPTTGGPYASSLTLQPVVATLAKPLAARVVLDAVTGRPLILSSSR